MPLVTIIAPAYSCKNTVKGTYDSALRQMLYLYGSFLSKITLPLLCIVVPVPYMSINPSKGMVIQIVFIKNMSFKNV